ADGAQSPRVAIPFPEDPYEAIGQAYLVETETPESPESPHTVASPTSLPDSAPPTRHAEESKGFDMIARMAVRVPHVMSHGLSASIAKVATMSDSTFRKRFRSSYESSPSSSPPDLPSRKRSRDTSELVEDEEEEDEEEDNEEVEERDEGLAEGDEGPDMRVESLGLGGDEVVPEGQQRAALVVETAMGKSDHPSRFPND
ncbi:hypothetical protein Tco_1534689, partial [Tanacetum coccineum]